MRFSLSCFDSTELRAPTLALSTRVNPNHLIHVHIMLLWVLTFVLTIT